MRVARALGGSFVVLGERVPFVIGALVGLTLLASVVGAVASRSGVPIGLLGLLSPLAVWRGQLWRLVTWVFFETEGLSLLFACLALWWFGRDLCYVWGPARFLAIYLGLAAASAGATCLIARFLWPELMDPRLAYHGNWPLVSAVLIAWAVYFPQRQMLQYLVIPVGGRNLIYFTIGVTVVFALLSGIALYVPHFVAIGLMLLYLREPSLQHLWLRLRLAAFQRGARRRGRLRAVDKDDWGKPPRWLH